MNAKQILWKFLINNGEVITNFNYYGNTVGYEETNTWRHISEQDDFLDYIDWEKTEDVKDGLMDKFEGTFRENPPVSVLEGVLVTQRGGELSWVFDADDINLTELILKVLQED